MKSLKVKKKKLRKVCTIHSTKNSLKFQGFFIEVEFEYERMMILKLWVGGGRIPWFKYHLRTNPIFYL